jgi:putative protease
MKSDLYVASVVAYYRGILDGESPRKITIGDLETVFSRRTTKLYLDGRGKNAPVLDPDSLGHVGTPVGAVKRVTRDREGLRWLRFHTSRALERHDGLQFEAVDENGRRLGMGIGEMRLAISRRTVFEAAAGSDVEILLPEADGGDCVADRLRPGMKIYCSASQAVRRLFPPPQARMSDCPGVIALDVEVKFAADGIAASTVFSGDRVEVSAECALEPAKNPEKTHSGVNKAFSRLGGTDYRLNRIDVDDGGGLFAPASCLNGLRRGLVEKLDDLRERKRRALVDEILSEEQAVPPRADVPRRVVRIRSGARVPAGEWDEVVVALVPGTEFTAPEDAASVRIAVPVYTPEPEFNRLRIAVKGLIRRGYRKWEAADLATLRMLKASGIEDITADWTLYAFNASALGELSRLGVRRFVASPENTKGNLRYLAESGYAVEFLVQQSTPLFISLTPPAASPADLAVYGQGGLWITTRPSPRVFEADAGLPTRVDLSWDVPG